MTDPLHEIAAMARRLADHYRDIAERWRAHDVRIGGNLVVLGEMAAADFDRIAEACEWKKATGGSLTTPMPARGKP